MDLVIPATEHVVWYIIWPFSQLIWKKYLAWKTYWLLTTGVFFGCHCLACQCPAWPLAYFIPAWPEKKIRFPAGLKTDILTGWGSASVNYGSQRVSATDAGHWLAKWLHFRSVQWHCSPPAFCLIVLLCVLFVSKCVLFVLKCVLDYCHRNIGALFDYPNWGFSVLLPQL
jgi:hypothetical protein